LGDSGVRPLKDRGLPSPLNSYVLSSPKDKLRSFEQWLGRLVHAYGDRIVPITARVAEAWGRLNVPDPVPVVDGLMAATALVHDWTLVTRNVDDAASIG